jgi:hypothetical protein
VQAAVFKGVPRWGELTELLNSAEELLSLTWSPGSERQRAELYRQLLMNVSLGYFLYFQADLVAVSASLQPGRLREDRRGVVRAIRGLPRRVCIQLRQGRAPATGNT